MLAVKDDGRGFSTAQPSAKGHYGLLGVRERAVLLDGTVHIESAPGHGTRIELRIPFVRERSTP